MEARGRTAPRSRSEPASAIGAGVARRQSPARHRTGHYAVRRGDGLQCIGDPGREELRKPVLLSLAPGVVGAGGTGSDVSGACDRLPALQTAGGDLLSARSDSRVVGRGDVFTKSK